MSRRLPRTALLVSRGELDGLASPDPREAKALELIADGLTNRQVGQQLEVTVHAVKFHLASICRKLGVMNRTEAAGLFFQHLSAAR